MFLLLHSFSKFFQASGPATLVIAAFLFGDRAEIVSEHYLGRFSAFQQLYGDDSVFGMLHCFVAGSVGVLEVPGENNFFRAFNFSVGGVMDIDVAFWCAYIQHEASADAEIELQVFDDVGGGVAAHPAIHLFLARERFEDSFTRRGDGAACYEFARCAWSCCCHGDSSSKLATVSLRRLLAVVTADVLAHGIFQIVRQGIELRFPELAVVLDPCRRIFHRLRSPAGGRQAGGPFALPPAGPFPAPAKVLYRG